MNIYHKTFIRKKLHRNRSGYRNFWRGRGSAERAPRILNPTLFRGGGASPHSPHILLNAPALTELLVNRKFNSRNFYFYRPKCPVYELSYQWNFMSVIEKSCHLIVLFMKCSFYKMSCFWKVLLLNFSVMRCSSKIICFCYKSE